jgi:hypothetical protein
VQKKAKKSTKSDSTDDLPTLLNFPLEKEMNPKDYYPHFEKIADKILNHSALVLKKGDNIKLYRLVEIEFYCKHESLHNDNFAHQDEDQLGFMQWYFHKQGKNYKGGTYKGLDIAFGKKDEKMYGGILIRTIQDASTMKFYEGSCNIVTEMFKFFGAKEVKDFVEANPHFSKTDIFRQMDVDEVKGLKDEKDANAISLVELTGEKTGVWSSRPFYSSPRVGLTLKRPAPEKEKFIAKNYRFCTNPEVIKKVKFQIYLGMLSQGKSCD